MISSWSTCHKILHILMFITSFGEQNITYKCCSNFLIHLYPYTFRPENYYMPDTLKCADKENVSERCPDGAIKEMQLYFQAGVDGIFADDPAIARKAVQNYLGQSK
ncbi:hypothetical protein GPS51_16855 [Acinetobacter haemolyticus]|nr:hypothetical protein [Acinetobacter haemolyticus]NAR68573.1 hypothetical protein [Acinetobacter haemolyticus]NAR71820.1 hypothetical protein [Acinetobacter haemolyticus]NAR84424.1 hypothetical protein [Acinetobacter haemolyticus]QHI22239.1 hypothetical protein Ahae5227_04345 [Acinetobacter haemolyticus]